MPTPEVAGAIWEVVLEGTQERQQVMNVMHFRVVTAVDDMEVRLLRALIVCLLTILRPVMGSNYQFVRAMGKRVSPDVGPIVELRAESGEEVQGDDAGDTLPSFVSVCTNIHTTRGGKSGRGRMFIPGVPEGATQGSFVEETNPYWTQILAYLACVASQFVKPNVETGSNVIQLGVMSRKIGGTKPPYLAAGFAAATRLTPNLKLASSNSRKVGRGS